MTAKGIGADGAFHLHTVSECTAQPGQTLLDTGHTETGCGEPCVLHVTQLAKLALTTSTADLGRVFLQHHYVLS